MERYAQINIGTEFGSVIGQTVNISDIISIILSNAVAIAGVVLFILLVIGGFLIITGAGSNNPQQTAQGRQAATAALIGFLIVFTTYWIIQIIETLTGFRILEPDPNQIFPAIP